jgi:hypothetical protein
MARLNAQSLMNFELEAQSVLRVLMVEQVDQTVLRFEMRSEAAAYISDSERIDLPGQRIAFERQVIGERHPMTARQGKRTSCRQSA